MERNGMCLNYEWPRREAVEEEKPGAILTVSSEEGLGASDRAYSIVRSRA